MKIIDFFNTPRVEAIIYGYSDGLYNFCDNGHYMGYKNLSGDVVIEPKAVSANPFLNKCALAYDWHVKKGFIDYQGEFNTHSNIFDYSKDFFTENIALGHYEGMNIKTGEKYAVVVKNLYSVDSDEIIMNVLENEKRLVK